MRHCQEVKLVWFLIIPFAGKISHILCLYTSNPPNGCAHSVAIKQKIVNAPILNFHCRQMLRNAQPTNKQNETDSNRREDENKWTFYEMKVKKWHSLDTSGWTNGCIVQHRAQSTKKGSPLLWLRIRYSCCCYSFISRFEPASGGMMMMRKEVE